MSDELMPDDLARLEAALERRIRPAPSAALRSQALDNLRSARALERNLLAGTVASVLLFTFVIGSLQLAPASEDTRQFETDAQVHAEGEIFERLGFDTPEAQSSARTLLAARIPCIAPAVGSNASMSALLRGL